MQLIPYGSPFWIGFNDIAVEGTYLWVDGTTWSYTNWNTGQPVAAGDCGYLVGNSGYKWGTGTCTTSIGYTCEFDAAAGAELLVWDEGLWKSAGKNATGKNGPFDATSVLTWTTSDATVLNRLFVGEEKSLNFAVRPINPNGSATGGGSIATDYAEVTVTYRLP